MTVNQRNPTLVERIGRVVDDIVEIVNPRSALERKRSRMGCRRLDAYNAASPLRSSAGWLPVDGKAELLNAPNRELMRARARDLERNSPIVNSVLKALTRNVVGKGFNLQVRTADAEWNNELERLWRWWCRPGNCDVTGRLSLKEILEMIVVRKVVDGGFILVKTYDKDAAVPLKLQLREVDDLDSQGQIRSPRGNPIVGGIEFDKIGKPLNYYLREVSIDDWISYKSNPVPAGNVYFLLDIARPTQQREITQLSDTMQRVNDLDEFYDATGYKQKISAATVMVIEQQDVLNDYGRPAVGRTASAGKEKDDGKVGPRITAGSIYRLRPGESAKMLVPNGQSSELAAFDTIAQRQIAASQGLSYEMASRDVSQVNYSSARQNLLEDWKEFENEQIYLVEHFLDLVFQEVVFAAVLNNQVQRIPADFWQNTEKYLEHEFIGPKCPWIDPLKEAQANTELLETGQVTLKDLYAQRGKDWESELEQRAKEIALMKKLGIPLERKETKTNGAKEPKEGEPGNGKQD